MGFKTFTAGSVLTAADLNDYLMEQTVIGCLSTGRPTGQAGMKISESDTGRELHHDGTNWIIDSEPAQSWTPTWSNITLGNGTVAAWYKRASGDCRFYVALTFGTTTSVSGRLGITVPITLYNTLEPATFTAQAQDVGTATYGLICSPSTSTVFYVDAIGTASTYGSATSSSASIPFSWGSTDRLIIAGRYRMTTPYS